MDRYYFIEVQRYKSVNKMGIELGEYVFGRYNHSVVHEGCIGDISVDIEEKMTELECKYPRCKHYKYEVSEHKDKNNYPEYCISAKPDNIYNDNYVFIMNTKLVSNMNLETVLLF